MVYLFNSYDFSGDFLNQEIQRVFYSFLKQYIDLSNTLAHTIDNFCFLEQIKMLKLSKTSVLYIDFEHMLNFSEELSDLIESQFKRIEYSLIKTIGEFLKNFSNRSFLD